MLSKEIKIQLEVSNITLFSNATVEYNVLDFSNNILSKNNYSLSYELFNDIESIENATAVNITAILPNDLIIHKSNGTIKGNQVDWQISQLNSTEYLYIDYESPTSIITNKRENISIFIEYCCV